MISQQIIDKLSKMVSQANAKKALDYLEQYGYLTKESASLEDSISDFQSMFGLKQTGQLSDKDLSVMDLPRCSVPDRMVAEAASLPSWSMKVMPLTWYIRGMDSDLPQSVWRSNIAESLNAIAQVCGLTFQQVNQEREANLIYDAKRIDRAGSTLAYAYLPPRSNYTSQSEMYFDTSERWVDSANQQGIWHYPVALHETLHLMGLSHNNMRGSILLPTYSPAIYQIDNYVASQLQSLYGKPTQSIPSTPQPTPNPTPAPTGQTTIVIDGAISNINIPGYRVTKLS